MARFLGIAFISIMAAGLLGCVAAQTVHVVGDGLGWAVPQGGATVYSNWAHGKTFAVGDILTFNFRSNEHDVLRVQKTSFDACSSTNGIGDAIMTGPTNITLTSSGEHYYICTIGRHCQFGQKLGITVSSRTSGGIPPPSTTPSPPTSPSPSSGNIPVDCAPNPSPPPVDLLDRLLKDLRPSTSTTPPPPGSSASNALASTLVSMLAIAMRLLL